MGTGGPGTRPDARGIMVISWALLVSSAYSLLMAIGHLLIVHLDAPDDYLQNPKWERKSRIVVMIVSFLALLETPQQWCHGFVC